MYITNMASAARYIVAYKLEIFIVRIRQPSILLKVIGLQDGGIH